MVLQGALHYFGESMYYSIPRMPFGRHRGCPLREIDTDYLMWVLNQDKIQPGLAWDVETELLARRRRRIVEEEQAAQAAPPPRALRVPPGVNPNVCRELLAAGRRALAHRQHPDRPGGDASAMVAANATADWLETLVAELMGDNVR
jgi:hypothetical protein